LATGITNIAFWKIPSLTTNGLSNMLMRYKILESGRRRLSDDAAAIEIYKKAVVYLTEKREILTRLNEINCELRKLHKLDAEIIAVAQDDVPFRNTPGRKKMNIDV